MLAREGERVNSIMSEAGARWRDALKTLVFLAPLAVPVLVPIEYLPAGVAYAVTQGRWLVVLGWLTAFVAVLRDGRGRLVSLHAGQPRAWAAGTCIFGTGMLLLVVPQERWNAQRFSGDEPKYLRLADSLSHDLDVDLASGHTDTLTARAFARNLRGLAQALAAAAADWVQAPQPELDAREWRAGHWTVAGRAGGHYSVHGAGLPLLLVPARVMQARLDPSRPHSLALLTLVGLWSAALWHTLRLAQEVSASSSAGALAGLLVAFSAPILLGGWHFYPEAAACAITPWLARGLRAAGSPLRRPRVVALAFACGALPWLHAKFVVLALLAFALLCWRVGRSRGRQALALLAASLPLAALLLFHHHVTGLLRPDALYLRYAPDFYAPPGGAGPPRLALGLVTALFGQRDGVFVMAPLALIGAIGLPWLWRRERRAALVVALLFCGAWLTAALHGGGAPGPPGRLMAPVLTLLAAPAALALVELRRDARLLWTVALAGLISVTVALTLAGSWRRAVDPYAGVFATPAVNFALDLPDAPRPGPRSTLRELARGALLLAGLGAWVAFVARRREPAPGAWRAARDFHAAVWATLIVLATLLSCLRAGEGARRARMSAAESPGTDLARPHAGAR